MPPLARRTVTTLIALVTTLTLASSAHGAVSCDGRALSQPFLPWLDPAAYVLVPGGDFEGAAHGWTLAGGAATAPGNEPFRVSGADDARSLSLPRGASATSPSFCAGLGYPTIRLFSKGGGLLGTISVAVVYRDAAGVLRSQSLGAVLRSGAWQPSLPLLTLAGLPLLTSDTLQLRLTAVGGSFSVDDVYVDPWGRH